jgi:catechol 2,3-dioxygenase-like lactoylglutathione lyase family enzyme
MWLADWGGGPAESTKGEWTMSLSNAEAVAVVAVKDIAKGKEFYEGKLGLSGGEDQDDGGVQYAVGNTKFHIYPSENAGGGATTAAYFRVDDVEGTVDELSGNGVKFEQYDSDELKTNEKGVAQLGDEQAAWFKDLDGNIIGLGSV